MLSGFYTAASGILTKQREMDVIGSNLTNINTPGYRAERQVNTSFEMELLKSQDANSEQILAESMATSVVVDDVITSFEMGTVKDTGRILDFAIAGEGFFRISNTEGAISLTRNGGFEVDEEGYLALPEVGRVQGNNGNIYIGNTDDFYVKSDGTIYNSQNQTLGTISIVKLQEGGTLTRNANGTFAVEQGVVEFSDDYQLVQGSLELSNADMNLELTKLIEAQRIFQACSSALQIVDEMNNKAATRIGSIS